jgi:hypothetical protein
MTPRDVLAMKPGVSTVLRPASEMRPSRGASAPVVLRSVNSIISGGNWSSWGAMHSSVILRVTNSRCSYKSVVVGRKCCNVRLLGISAWWGAPSEPTSASHLDFFHHHVLARQSASSARKGSPSARFLRTLGRPICACDGKATVVSSVPIRDLPSVITLVSSNCKPPTTNLSFSETQLFTCKEVLESP